MSWVHVFADLPSAIANAGPEEQRKVAIALQLDGPLG